MRRPPLTADNILEAADRIARGEGMEALTVRRLCAELGVTAPAIYLHFEGKNELVARLVNSILGRIELPSEEEGDWLARLEEFVVRVYDQVSRYPGLAARIAHQLPGTASSRRNQAFVAELLASSGLSTSELGNLTAVVFLYTWGHLVGGEASWQVGGFPRVPRSAARDRFLWGLGHLLASFRLQPTASTGHDRDRKGQGS
jgi:AcrR family transcriptional regulator